jgi:hypothetical protein
VKILYVILSLIAASVPTATHTKDFLSTKELQPPHVDAPMTSLGRGGRQKQDVPGLEPIQPPPSLPPKIELPKKPDPCLPGRPDC